MRIAVLGAGGQVADAIGILLAQRGYDVSHYRFRNTIHLPGVPVRPRRSQKRYSGTAVLGLTGSELEETRSKYHWVGKDDIAKADVVIYALPSYLAEYTGHSLSNVLDGKVLINLSNRFLGTYSLAVAARRANPSFRPGLFVAFNSPPLLPYQANRETFGRMLYQKPSVMCSCFPNWKEREAKRQVADLFAFDWQSIRFFPSELDLSFENVNSIVHAVQDLHNLSIRSYGDQGYGSLYGTDSYHQTMESQITSIVNERNAVARVYSSRKFRSLREFDLSTFRRNDVDDHLYDSSVSFRQQHDVLSLVPKPTWYNAHGYEDVGWSLVPMESFGRLANVRTPQLSSLIDQWTRLMRVDYRRHGRDVESLDLIAPRQADHAFVHSEFSAWNWQFDAL